MTTLKPRPGQNPGAALRNIRLGKTEPSYFNKIRRSVKPLPLFGAALEGAEIFVICGDGALDAASEPAFVPRAKLVLPPSHSQFDYRWPVAGRACWIVDRGAKRELKLQVQGVLMQAGADSVSYYEMADWYIS